MGRSTLSERPGLELYVDADVAWAKFAGKAIIMAGLPVWLFLAYQHRSNLRRSKPRYEGSGALYWNTVGPAALHGVMLERLGWHQAPCEVPYEELVTNAQVSDLLLGGPMRLIVADNFYSDPESVRQEALAAHMTRFDKGWYNTIQQPRLATPALEEARAKLMSLLQTELPPEAFYSDCGGKSLGWNGAFHAKLREDWLSTNACDIHNHSNLGSTAWSGLVYLDHREGPGSGTTLWTRRATGRCAEEEWLYDARPQKFRPLTRIPAKFNRLVLFLAPILHRGEAGYGWDKSSARLFQTFFFQSRQSETGTPSLAPPKQGLD
jgi:hypothetical protein